MTKKQSISIHKQSDKIPV